MRSLASFTPHVPTLSFRTTLILGACGLVLLTGSAITWLAHRSARLSTETLTDALFREASAHAVSETREFMGSAPPVVRVLLQLADNGLDLKDTNRLARQLFAFLKSNPGLSWVSFSDESGSFTGAYREFGEYHVRQTRIVNGKTPKIEYDVLADGTWRQREIEKDNAYDPRVRPFYVKAKTERKLVWLPPYIFYDQGVPGISCAAPLLNRDKKFLGVFTADFDLNSLSTFVSRLTVSPHSRFFIYTADEKLLAHPTQRLVGTAGQKTTGKLLTLADTNDPLVDAFRGRVPAGPLPTETSESFQRFDFTRDGIDYLASTTAFRVGDDQTWVVAAVAPKADFLADVWHSQTLALIFAAGALLIAVLLAAVMAQSVSTPVLKLIGFMNKVGGGDLEASAAFGGSRDFRNLADALNRMIADLRDRDRVRYSLGVAMEVQRRLLPADPPSVRGLDVAGHSTYCDETGGDYYDFLVLDQTAPGAVLIVLGDVMGHGVAAALVMAGVRAVLRDRVQAAGSLAELMSRLNQMIAADHQGERFMTLHLSVIDSATRTMRWTSAGHDPAIVYDPESDRFEEIGEGNLPLGVLATTEYEEQTSAPLRPGQIVLVGTDGVWEMPDPNGDAFGKDRLREVIRTSARGSAADISTAIRERLVAFRRDARQVDDVTFVVVKVLPEADTNT
ncbi:MAG TPA: SpoIIE family protein phosphatase [Fimbriiglobus sp.]|jgi:serine phosphatase RsbU (regulator of sigma subunit)